MHFRMQTIALFLLSTTAALFAADAPLNISGRYPHLAMLNHNGECGTGAVVPWADRLWVITYGPHLPEGSDDKLYEIDAELNRTIHSESVGGTPANRMIHRESNQLNIGSYFIDAERHVRVIPLKQMPGRLTATARHLTDPANKLYIYTMEGTTYEVDVHTLEFKTLFERPVPGWHGKGAYSGQGRLILANNGESHVAKTKSNYVIGSDKTGPEDAGVLAEFDGKDWRIIERRQFTDVTGPGGIEGSPSADSPIWALGWDKRSVLLKLLDHGNWQSFRLPKADYSYDGKHGWHTEWPRIRDAGAEHMLMNMHGGWFEFPKTFSAGNTAGIRPIASYLKITGDFCAWKDQIVFGCDDLALSDFGSDNVLKAGNQSQSNLWFSRWEDLSKCGKAFGCGGPWLNDDVKAGIASDPYLMSGGNQSVLHMSQGSENAVNIAIEIDSKGNGEWSPYQTIALPPHGYAWHVFPAEFKAEWIRMKCDHDCTGVSAYFHSGPGGGSSQNPGLFASISDIGENVAWTSGKVRARGDDKGTLLFESKTVTPGSGHKPGQWFETDTKMNFSKIDEPAAKELAESGKKQDDFISFDDASMILTQDKIHYRLPKLNAAYESPDAPAPQIREIVTERSILNVGGSMYMLPRLGSGGAPRIKPICTHGKRIADFCSWRGLLVMTGCKKDAKPDGHYFGTADGTTGLWFGDIDDLWKLGKPRGKGGPWLNSSALPNQPSDPYLMTGYDKKTLELSHDSTMPIHVTIQVDFVADGSAGRWHTFKIIEVPPGQPLKFEFPAGYSAHWVRFVSDTACKATAQLTYE